MELFESRNYQGRFDTTVHCPKGVAKPAKTAPAKDVSFYRFRNVRGIQYLLCWNCDEFIVPRTRYIEVNHDTPYCCAECVCASLSRSDSFWYFKRTVINKVIY